MLTIYINLTFEVFIINKLRTATFLSDLRKQPGLDDFELTSEQIRRIKLSTTLSCLTNNWFSGLTGCRKGKDAIQKALYLGALTPLLDDLTDDLAFSHVEMFERMKDQQESVSSQIRLAGYLYDRVMKDQDKRFRAYFKEVMKAQDESLKQLHKDKLSFEELYKISCAKGGYSTLLYRSVLGTPLIRGEEEAIYLLGGILQLTNDMFDVYKDYKNGQQTVFTNTEDVEKLKALYVELINEMCVKFLALKYPFENIRQTLLKIFVILSRGMVCIDQLIACQKRTDNIFLLEQYSRVDLICDMEKVANIKKSIRICYSWKRRIENSDARMYPFE